MQCISPLNIPRPNGRGNADRVVVPCGKCMACLSKARSHWSYRLKQELKSCSSAFFVTLTYDDDHLFFNNFGVPSVNKEHIQLFFKRLRKYYYGNSKSDIRYFLSSEYGPNTSRPHYHGIFFNIPDDFEGVQKQILNCWSHGHVHVGTVTGASIGYVAKYCVSKSFVPEDADKVFSLMSRRPGIGANYLTSQVKEWHGADSGDKYFVVGDGGVKQSMPRYYRDKIFSKESQEARDVFVPKLVDPVKYKGSIPISLYEMQLKEDYSRRVANSINKTSKL